MSNSSQSSVDPVSLFLSNLSQAVRVLDSVMECAVVWVQCMYILVVCLFVCLLVGWLVCLFVCLFVCKIVFPKQKCQGANAPKEGKTPDENTNATSLQTRQNSAGHNPKPGEKGIKSLMPHGNTEALQK